MCVRDRVKSLSTLRLGLLFLLLANVINYVSRRVDTDIDFVMGVTFGVSFGLLLLSMWRGRTDPACLDRR